MRTLTLIVVLLATVSGCGGKTAADYQKEAQAALDGRDSAKAVQLADAGLATEAVRKDPPAAWRLEQIRLDALAQGGKGAQVATDLDRIAQAYPKQVTAALYRSLADRARGAGDSAGAIEILTAGDKRFPDEHTTFADAITALKNAGELDPNQVEKLKSLGYL